MPVIVKLSPDEVRAEMDKGKSQRQIVMEQYDAMLDGFEPSDWGEVKLDDGEKRATVRNRLKSAAERRELDIRFKRGQGDRMRFEVYAKGSAPPEDSDDDEIAASPPAVVVVAEKPKRARKTAASAVSSDQPPASGSKRGPGRPRSVKAEA